MVIENEDSFIYEHNGINIENEGSLHSAVKEWYSTYGDRLEARVENSIIDIVRGDLLIEVQTANFAAIRKKLAKLLKNHKIRLVYPIAKEKIITRVSASGEEVLSSRKSSKKGKVTDIFNELVRIPALINEENLTIEVLLIKEEEIRCEDGKGSWRRRGQSIIDKKLVEVFEKVEFSSKDDFLKLLPTDLCHPFTTKDLAGACGYRVTEARKIAYCLKKMGVINEVGKKGNSILYQIN
ncbi:MAG: hypothetical protein N3I35_05875 [Clostridia bacterium]|nr:hypothetical protein [Clostridia bacterium]